MKQLLDDIWNQVKFWSLVFGISFAIVSIWVFIDYIIGFFK